jgi:nucleotide-binding universal stress UspA family protein
VVDVQRIVVGIDGSAPSARALEYAADEAVLTGRDLEIVHALDLPADVDFYGVHVVGAQVESLQGYAEQLLASAVNRIRELHPELSCTSRYQIGGAATVLIEASQEADAMVVGSRGLGGLGRAVLGSVSGRIATTSACPVFVIGDHEDLPADGPIVVGVDDSEFGVAALRFAITEAALRGTRVRAVHAYRTPVLAAPVEPELIIQLTRSEQEAAAKIIENAVSEVGEARGEVEIETVAVEGSPADVITGQAADAQLIVIGSHGKGLVRRLLLGSVSRRVLNDADRPVVVVDVPESDD